MRTIRTQLRKRGFYQNPLPSVVDHIFREHLDYYFTGKIQKEHLEAIADELLLTTVRGGIQIDTRLIDALMAASHLTVPFPASKYKSMHRLMYRYWQNRSNERFA